MKIGIVKGKRQWESSPYDKGYGLHLKGKGSRWRVFGKKNAMANFDLNHTALISQSEPMMFQQ